MSVYIAFVILQIQAHETIQEEASRRTGWVNQHWLLGHSRSADCLWFPCAPGPATLDHTTLSSCQRSNDQVSAGVPAFVHSNRLNSPVPALSKVVKQ